MSVVLFILSFLIVFALMSALANQDAKRNLKNKRNGTYLPPDYYAQDAGFAPKDKDYPYWKRKENEIKKRRALAKQKQKEERWERICRSVGLQATEHPRVLF